MFYNQPNFLVVEPSISTNKALYIFAVITLLEPVTPHPTVFLGEALERGIDKSEWLILVLKK